MTKPTSTEQESISALNNGWYQKVTCKGCGCIILKYRGHEELWTMTQCTADCWERNRWTRIDTVRKFKLSINIPAVRPQKKNQVKITRNQSNLQNQQKKCFKSVYSVLDWSITSKNEKTFIFTVIVKRAMLSLKICKIFVTYFSGYGWNF